MKNKTNSILSLSVATLTLVPALVQAAPAIENSCARDMKIVDPDNGTGVVFAEDCSVAYVLPPQTGASKIGTLVENMNIDFCPAAQEASSVAKTTMKTAAKAAKRLEKATEKVDKLQEQEEEFQVSYDEALAAQEDAEGKLELAEELLEQLEADYDEAKEAFDDCVDETDDEDECEEQADARSEAKSAFKGQRKKVNKAKKAVKKATKNANKLERKLDRLDNKIIKKEKPILELQDLLIDLNLTVKELYKEYASMEGAVGNIYYLLEWDKLLQGYTEKNKDFPGRFLPVSLEDMRFHIAAYVGKASTVPALLAANVPGLGELASPSTEPEVSEEPVTIEPASLGFQEGAIHQSIRGGHSNGANIAMSLAGVCKSYDEESKSLIKNTLDGALIAGLTYSYQLQAKRQYVARYSMSHWVESMEKKVSKKRPFSSETLNEVANDAGSSSWMSIDFTGNDSEFEYSAEEQAAITKEVAAALMTNSLNQLAVQNGIQLPSVPRAELTETGLQKWGKRKKRCGWFSWCYITNYAGNFLADVWSNKKAIAKFRKSNSGWQRQEVSGTKMVRRHGSVVFLPSAGPLEPSEEVEETEGVEETEEVEETTEGAAL